MDKFALSHIAEIYQKSVRQGQAKATGFYVEEEIDEILSYLKNTFKNSYSLNVVKQLGGYEDAERKRLLFSEEPLIEESQYVQCLRIDNLNRFAQPFQHREILGSLMGLGLKRELIGDIIIYENSAYVFYMPENQEMILLEKVGKNAVKTSPIALNVVPLEKSKIIKNISIPSLRLDTLLAHAFSLSREEAKTAIEKELVKVNQNPVSKNDYVPKENEKISLKGKGKFRYLGEIGQSKKGKLIVEIEVYS